MELFQQLKALGLPVLEAQLHCTRITLDKVLSIVRSKQIASRMELTVYNDLQPFTEVLCFPSPETIPTELRKGLEDYAQRLIAERMQIEKAIEDLRLQAFSHN